MRIEEAIKKAIKEGWKPGGIAIEPIQKVLSHYAENWEYPTTDASFWKSLGKAVGWPNHYHLQLGGGVTPCDKRDDMGPHSVSGWRAHWHRFIDHLADGKSAEEFFESLE